MIFERNEVINLLTESSKFIYFNVSIKNDEIDIAIWNDKLNYRDSRLKGGLTISKRINLDVVKEIYNDQSNLYSGTKSLKASKEIIMYIINQNASSNFELVFGLDDDNFTVVSGLEKSYAKMDDSVFYAQCYDTCPPLCDMLNFNW